MRSSLEKSCGAGARTPAGAAAMLSLRLTVDSATYGRSHFLFPSPASLSLPRSPFLSPFPVATYRRAKKNGARRHGAQILSFICGSHLSASHLSPSPPSLSYSLSSISTGSLVRRSLDLGCEARGVRRTLGPGLLSLSLVAQRRCASSTAGRLLRCSTRQGAGAAAGREQRPRRRVTRRGTTSSSSSRPLLPAQSG